MAVLAHVSVWIIPSLLFFIPFWAYCKHLPVYELFAEGAMEGVKTAIKIFPYLMSMLIAISIFREGGGLAVFSYIIAPAAHFIGIPTEVVPLIFIRPLSGSASLAMTAQLLQIYGPDSLIGRMASVMQGSTDTTFYILTVYFGSQGIYRYRHAVFVGLLADCAAFLAAAILCVWFFGPGL